MDNKNMDIDEDKLQECVKDMKQNEIEEVFHDANGKF